MESAHKIKEHYCFTEDDEKNLLRLRPWMEEERSHISREFYHFIRSTPEIAPYVQKDDAIKHRHQAAIGQWFVELFKGRYDQRYFLNLQRIGSTHVRIGLSGHYVNAGMNLIRNLSREVIEKKLPDPVERQVLINSLDKILDINLDIITSSYREAELRKVFLSYRFDETLLRFAERFSFALKLILVLSLMGISLAVVALFVGDVVSLFRERTAAVVLGALGSLLIIWVMVELMENEIRQLRGGKFKIQIFLGVALVAFIREMLITSLQHESAEKQFFILGAILSLGIVYWLISRAESLSGHSPE